MCTHVFEERKLSSHFFRLPASTVNIPDVSSGSQLVEHCFQSDISNEALHLYHPIHKTLSHQTFIDMYGSNS